MRYYTFLPEFHQAILGGAKHSTVRGKKKVNVNERFALRHWTGKPYRSKMDFLGTAVCVGVYKIKIDEPVIDGSKFTRAILSKEFWESPFAPKYRHTFAEMEGFKDMLAMSAWFRCTHGLPFTGVLTVWDPKSFIPGPPEVSS